MYTYIYIYIYVSIYVSISIYLSIYLSLYIYIIAYENFSQASNLNLVQTECKLTYILYANNFVLKIRYQS